MNGIKRRFTVVGKKNEYSIQDIGTTYMNMCILMYVYTINFDGKSNLNNTKINNE